MSFKLGFEGFTLEVDTAEELKQALAIIRTPPGVRLASIPEVTTTNASLSTDSPVDARLLRRFLRAIPDRQQSLLNSLANAPEGLTDGDLRIALGLQTNGALGGTMSGLAKNARKLHFGIEHILTKTQTQNGTGRHYHYAITEEMKGVMLTK